MFQPWQGGQAGNSCTAGVVVAAAVALLEDPTVGGVADMFWTMSSGPAFAGMDALADTPVDVDAGVEEVSVASTTRPLGPKKSSMHLRASAIVVGSARVRVVTKR